jgi:inorganic phosphate transporter, PiT family
MDQVTVLLVLFVLTIIQDILIGIFSAPGIIATMIASRAMSPRKALLLSTITQLIGPLAFGVTVAHVIGSEVFNTRVVTSSVLLVALSATIVWMIISWYLHVPSSSTHALLGGLLGSVLVAAGPSAIYSSGLLKILISLAITAPLAMLGGFLVVRASYWLVQNASPRINDRFIQGQWLTSIGLGLVIGSINAQNVMGMMTLGLVLTGFLPQFEVPNWVIGLSALGLAFGNLIGGTRLIKTVGAKFFQVRPIHGFSAQVASAVIIGIALRLGGNVSATHVTSLAVVGAGAAERLSMVRWGFVQNVLITWLVTIPFTALLGGLVYLGLSRIGAQ